MRDIMKTEGCGMDAILHNVKTSVFTSVQEDMNLREILAQELN